MPWLQTTAAAPVLDMSGRALHQQDAQLHRAGPAVRVELPGAIIAWSVPAPR